MESLKNLSKECICLLHRNNLLFSLVKDEIIKNDLSEVIIPKDIKDKTISDFIHQNNLSEGEKFQNFLNNNLINQKQFEDNVLKDIKIKQYSMVNYENKIEAHFLQRKKDLDVVVYSLIRLKDFFKAKELYLRIKDEEAEFGDIASEFSEGVEKKTRGIIGPSPLSAAHPKLAEKLRFIQPGEVFGPITVSQTCIIVRLETFDPAILDDFMRIKMSEELFNLAIDKKAKTLTNEIINSHLRN